MSTIKVNKLEQRSGCTATVGGGAGKTVTVDATTVTLGRCGATVSLASGASQTGFGRTGTVNWCTTAKTSPLTSVSGNGYFINTTGGAVTVTLPASPSAGDIVAFSDYASTFQTNALTICRNSSKINGGCFNGIVSTQGAAITLVYVDGTRGWKQVNDATLNVSGVPSFITASGGTETTCGDYKIHTFTSTSCFAVTTAPTPANNKISYLVVAGGGGSYPNIGGGGGGGGFREGKLSTDPYTASPLAATPCSALTIAAATTYPVTVGAGGAGGCSRSSGTTSIFSTITSAGGGASGGAPSVAVVSGGSGGGAGGNVPGGGGAGNIPAVSPAQGQPGGGAGTGFPALGAGGGGGASAAGGSGSSPSGGPGGDGAGTAINTAAPIGAPGPSGSLRYYSGGGGGGGYANGSGNSGGYGGGGNANSAPPAPGNGTNGTANAGGGAGGSGMAGGSGIVIIRYKFQ
jgi:hypothetical protein|tara:strand:- start:208 stop:1587 length:1380 start_codon:yes stop_codon:yes gene_type:complete